MLNLRTAQTGVTLIELAIGLVIIGILMAVAMPSYRAWVQNTQIRNVTESILNGLQLARAEALQRNTPVQFVMGANSDWTVGCVTPVGDLDHDGKADCPATIQSRSTSEGSSASVIVTPTPVAGSTIVFNSFGATVAPTAPAVAFTRLDVDVDTAVLPAAESRELRITIGAGGNARMCDPSPTLSASDPRRC